MFNQNEPQPKHSPIDGEVWIEFRKGMTFNHVRGGVVYASNSVRGAKVMCTLAEARQHVINGVADYCDIPNLSTDEKVLG